MCSTELPSDVTLVDWSLLRGLREDLMSMEDLLQNPI